ncbi:glutamine amidotransferase [Acuticoccus sp. M5D2P5]|uniref:glutamine amidotransferase n=1 Tax=Acuticoccus kalidii TaxID=2910977 RepID=UPI001F425C17|nr:glutamine amidotransferase [Acuticoccus kalidii]MCF3935149.1 glutamine amidotransferase [Acuticoccus kalidii]
MPRPTVQAIRHIHFEDLGRFAAPLAEAGYTIDYVEAAERDLASLDPLAADLLVVLGGPIGVGDAAAYPVIAQEIALLKARLAADRPTLGICLGAQLMARALGAAVHAGAGREIGWSPVTLTPEGMASPLAALDGTPVLHWHGDNFDLPAGCHRLAATPVCPTQAFARGPNVLALQFHAEAAAERFEHWLIGHAAEIAHAGIDPVTLRADAEAHGERLGVAAAAMLRAWLTALRPSLQDPAA